MSRLEGLKPEAVWNFFAEICQIPHTSGNEGKIREYLLNFANKNGLESKEDKVGNILITKPASPGKEHLKPIVLQGHMDMVGEKDFDNPHNWKTDPIIPFADGDYVKAKGTTLGADDGIGVAIQMAILTDKNISCGMIECLFTVDEETGMTGAINLEPDFFKGTTLLNLDSEDEGILFIGCAGGLNTEVSLQYKPVSVSKGLKAMTISITGFHGGHSGDEIHKGYGNSIKTITRLLQRIVSAFNVSVADINGGNLRNAIPREAFATITFRPEDETGIYACIEEYLSVLKKYFNHIEPDIKITHAPAPLPETAIDDHTCMNLLNSLLACPHGVIAWSVKMPDMVETSNNLAIVRMEEGNQIRIFSSQRSSSDIALNYTAAMVRACFELAGGKVSHYDPYPGWEPDINSRILKLTKASYQKLFHKEPLVKSIHAGLECGLFYEKNKSLDMISIGPTIKGPHTVEEKIEIATVQMFWDLLLDVICNCPA
jgi:dipeptidase D